MTLQSNDPPAARIAARRPFLPAAPLQTAAQVCWRRFAASEYEYPGDGGFTAAVSRNRLL